ncbi:M-phase inducer phosphatase 1-like [Glandiceps talaboti]
MTTESSRRGSLPIPFLLQGKDSFSSPASFGAGQTVLSPMTDLAMNLSGLSTSFSETPKRRLSLSSCDTPTPSRPSSLSSDAGCCLDSPSPQHPSPIFSQRCFTFTAIHQPSIGNVLECGEKATLNNGINSEHLDNNSNGSSSSGAYSDSENSNDGESVHFNKDRKKLVIRRPMTMKRCKTMPVQFSGFLSSTPPSSDNINKRQEKRPTILSPCVSNKNHTTFFIGDTLDKENITQESIISRKPPSKDDFKFVEPLPPMRRPLGNGNFTNSGYTPPKKRPISAPASLLNDDSPITLSKSSLTSTDEEDDDGFLELIDDDLQENANPGIGGMAGLLSAPIIGCSPVGCISMGTDEVDGCAELPPSFPELNNADTPASGSRTKRGLFRSPSVPCGFSSERSSFLKRPERSIDLVSPIQSKRRCSIASPQCVEKQLKKSTPKTTLSRSKSVIETDHINRALMIGGDQHNLIGDFSKQFALPLTKGKHQDLKSITPDTMRRLLNDEFEDIEYSIVDCRYPYEYQGGHIKNAKNIWTKPSVLDEFLSGERLKALKQSTKRHILVFHCEFSSERAPKLSRFLRNKDRDCNKESYPALHYPELYLLDGGYKLFFESCKDLCEPQTYKQMLDKDHTSDFRHFRSKSKSWAGERSRMGSQRFKNL